MKKQDFRSEVTFDKMPQAVARVYEEVFLMRTQMNEIAQNFQPKVPNEYLTRQEVSELLKCDLSTVHNWSKKGKLFPYCIGNRVLYKRSEVEASLIPFGTFYMDRKYLKEFNL